MPQINNAAIGGTMIQKVIFFYFLYLFRHTALKQLPIKKLYKVIIGKTVSKSTMSANKPSESLCSLLAITFIPYTNKTCSNKSNFRLPKNIDTHIFGLRWKVRFQLLWCQTARASVGMWGDSGWRAPGWRCKRCTLSTAPLAMCSSIKLIKSKLSKIN